MSKFGRKAFKGIMFFHDYQNHSSFSSETGRKIFENKIERYKYRNLWIINLEVKSMTAVIQRAISLIWKQWNKYIAVDLFLMAELFFKVI